MRTASTFGGSPAGVFLAGPILGAVLTDASGFGAGRLGGSGAICGAPYFGSKAPLLAYARVAKVPLEQIVDDDLELIF